LARRYRTIRFDNRGVGRTGVAPGLYPIQLMAADAAAVLDAAGESSAHVIGASLGGLIAQELALTAPEKVLSLVLASTDPGGPHAVETEAHRRIAAGVEPPPSDVLIPLLYSPMTPRERIEEISRSCCSTPHRRKAAGTRSPACVRTPGAYPRLGQINQPTLILHEPPTAWSTPATRNYLPAASHPHRSSCSRAAGHILAADQPERFTELVVGFLEAVSADDQT
jgi:pimeloyl-ACP methyl ester carboxylesterase